MMSVPRLSAERRALKLLASSRRQGDRQQTRTVALLPPQVADADSQELSARRWPRRITPHPSRAGASDDNKTSVPPGGNLEGPGSRAGANRTRKT